MYAYVCVYVVRMALPYMGGERLRMSFFVAYNICCSNMSKIANPIFEATLQRSPSTRAFPLVDGAKVRIIFY